MMEDRHVLPDQRLKVGQRLVDEDINWIMAGRAGVVFDTSGLIRDWGAEKVAPSPAISDQDAPPSHYVAQSHLPSPLAVTPPGCAN